MDKVKLLTENVNKLHDLLPNHHFCASLHPSYLGVVN